MDELRVAAEHWSQRRQRAGTRWWQHQRIVRHVNRTICGRDVPGMAGGDITLLRDRFPAGFDRAVSIGCGEGRKEMALLATGVVRHFDLFEISQRRVEDGRAEAAERMLGDRITWHEQTMDFQGPGAWDLVYWNNALHHMLDVDQALQWSGRVAPCVYVNDFVGPDRMQWPDDQLEVASRVRGCLPERLLGSFGTDVKRPHPEQLADDDPTEAADSGNILDAVRRHFPHADLKLTGGAIYHLALNDILANFTEEDEPLLDLLLILDDMCIAAGQTHYAVALHARLATA